MEMGAAVAYQHTDGNRNHDGSNLVYGVKKVGAGLIGAIKSVPNDYLFVAKTRLLDSLLPESPITVTGINRRIEVREYG